ncbi:hypothetical protein GCM10023169_12600 [Georgenia halophila]|uniref:DUF1778 domain-containing protein n=1 Tax=Georgenia halophila TaxID=620889 RepID=A0ABP8KVM6_9MICO
MAACSIRSPSRSPGGARRHPRPRGRRRRASAAPGYAKVLQNDEQLKAALTLKGLDIKDNLPAREYDVLLDLAVRPSSQAASKEVLDAISAEAKKGA